MLAALLLGAALSAANAAPVEEPRSLLPQPTQLSAEQTREIERLERALDASPTARRLLAETGTVPRRSWRLAPAAVAYVYGAAPFLAFDPEALPKLTEREFQLELSRELALAALDLPLDLPEGRDAARARAAEVALELAQSDRAFGKKLRGLAKADARELAAGERGELQVPRNEVERVALDLAELSRGRQAFLWQVESGLPPDPARVSRTELEDFVKLNGPAFGGKTAGPSDRYVWIAGRRYRAALLRAAQPLIESGGLKRVAEALDGFEGRELPELCRKAAKFAGR